MRRSAGDRPQLAQEPGVDHAHAALALHRLDDHRAHALGVERRVELGGVALDDRHAAGQRLERRAVGGAVGGGERAHRAPVERAAQRDHLVLGARAERPRRLDLARRAPIVRAQRRRT
jgi:hypothetical protein